MNKVLKSEAKKVIKREQMEERKKRYLEKKERTEKGVDLYAILARVICRKTNKYEKQVTKLMRQNLDVLCSLIVTSRTTSKKMLLKMLLLTLLRRRMSLQMWKQFLPFLKRSILR